MWTYGTLKTRKLFYREGLKCFSAALLLLAGSAVAADVALVGAVTSDIERNTTNWSETFNADGVELILAFVQTQDGSSIDDDAAVTFAGQAMTPVPNGDRKSTSGQDVRTQVFYYVNSAISGYTGNQTVTVTLDARADFLDFSVVGFARVEKSDPIQDSANDGTSGDLSVSLDTGDDGTYAVWAGLKNDDGNLVPFYNPSLSHDILWDDDDRNDLSAEGWAALVADSTNSQQVGFGLGGDRGVLVAVSVRPDNTAPTVTLASMAPPDVMGPITVTVELSEESENFTQGDITPTNASVSGFTQVDASHYEFTLTAAGAGVFTAVVNAGRFTDYAGNNNTASNVISRTFGDEDPPTVESVVRATGQPNPTNAATVQFTVTFSEDVTGVDTADFAVATTGSVTGAFVTDAGADSGDTRTVTVNRGSGDGTVGLNVLDDDTIIDGASNPLDGGFTGGEVFTIDATKPTLSLSSGAPSPNVTGPITVDVTLSEDSSTFGSGDITPSNAAVSGFTVVDDSHYSFTLTPSSYGAFSAVVNANTFTDAVGNTNTASNVLSRNYVDGIPPVVDSVVRAVGQADPTMAPTIEFFVTFSEGVTGVDATDFTLTTTGSVVGAFVSETGADSGATRTVVVNRGSGSGTIRLDVLDDNSIVDAYSNPLGGGFTGGEFFTIDESLPEVDGSEFDPEDYDPNPAIDLSEEYRMVFDTTNLTLTLYWRVLWWWVEYGVVATGEVAYTEGGIEVGLFCFENFSFTGAIEVVTQGARPLVLLSRQDVVIGVNFDLSGEGGDGADGGAGKLGGSNGGDKENPGEGLGGAGVRSNDAGAGGSYCGVGGRGAANNTNVGAVYGQDDLFDLYGGSGGAGGGDDSGAGGGGAGGGAISVGALGTIHIESAGTLAAKGGGGAWEEDHSGGGGSGGAILLSAPAVIVDGVLSVAGGNGGGTTGGNEGGGGGGGGRIAIYADTSTVGAAATVSLDGGVGGTGGGQPGTGCVIYEDAYSDIPVVDSIVRLDANPTNGPTADFRVTFSMNVNGVGPEDFDLTTSGLSGATVGTVTPVSGAVYDVAANVGSGVGTLRLDVNDQDGITSGGGTPLGGEGAGNGDFTSGEVYDVDTVAPTVVIGSPSPASTSSGPVDFLVTYSGASDITLTAGDADIVAGSVSGTVSVLPDGPNTRIVRVSGITGNGPLQVFVYAGTANDEAGNLAPESAPSPACTVDNLPPAIDIVGPDTSLTVNGPVHYTVNYTGASTITLNPADIILQQLAGNAWGDVSVDGSGDSRTVAIDNVTGDGTLTISLAAGTAADAAGNPALEAGPATPFDVLSAGVTLSVGSPSVARTKSGPVTFDITYTNAASITLSPANIALNGAPTGTVSVSTVSPNVRRVTVNNIAGDGPLGIIIAAGTGQNPPLPPAPGATSVTFYVDNTPPAISVVAPTSPSCGGDISWDVTYTDASPLTLDDTKADFHLNDVTGAENCTITGANTCTVTLTGAAGYGTAAISLLAGSAVDSVGNTAEAWGPSSAVLVKGAGPTVTVGGPSVTSTANGPVEFTVTYENADEITLSPSDVTVHDTGGAGASVEVNGSGNTTRTVRLVNITGDGTLAISVDEGSANNGCHNAEASEESASVTVDNTGPEVNISAPSKTVTNTGPVSYTVSFTGAQAVSLNDTFITLNKTGDADADVAVSGSGVSFRTVTLSNITGDGTLSISVNEDSATDSLGNEAEEVGPSVGFTVDNTPPTFTVTGPDPALTSEGPIEYVVSYTGASEIDLPSMVTLNKSGSADGVLNVTGSGAERTVEIASVTGTGTLGISIDAGSAKDEAGNEAAAYGPSPACTIDNTPPTISIGAPSAAITRSGPVRYTVTYSGASAITLDSTDLQVSGTGSVSADVEVTTIGTNTRRVTFNNISGEGDVWFSIDAGTAEDAAGNTADAAGPSDSFTVDNTPPEVSLGDPVPDITRNGPVSAVVTYTDADEITLSPADVILHPTGGVTATVGVSAGKTETERTITFTGIAGDGELSYSIAAGTAEDEAGNSAAGAGPSSAFTADNTPPAVTVGEPSVSITRSGPVTFSISYTDAETITLSPADVSLVRTGDANGTVSVGGTGSEERTVSIENITGDGTIAIGIAAGAAVDAVGNPAPAAGPSSSFVVNNEAVSLSIGSPSAFVTQHGPVTFPITYENAHSVSLSDAEVVVNTTGTATGDATVSGSDAASRTVTIDNIGGDGKISISILAGTAVDGFGDPAPAAGPSAQFTVDNTPPAVSIGQPSVNLTRNGPVTFQVDYTGANSITLEASDVLLDSTGSASADVSISGAGAASRTVTLTNLSGNGTLGISIEPGTASDDAGNLALGAASSGVCTVDTSRPVATINAPSPDLTRSGPASWTIDFAGASTITLSPAHLTLTRTGTADAVAVITGSGANSRTVTLQNATGDGTISLSILADAARDTAGNQAEAVGPSAPITIDNTPPVITLIGSASVDVEYTTPYVDAGATAVDSREGDISGRIDVANFVDTEVPGTYTVSYSVSDSAGNPAQIVVRTVHVYEQTVEETMFELLGGSVCRPGICVIVNGNRVFTPAGVLKVTIDRPELSIFPPGMLVSVIPGTWFFVKPQHIRANDLGRVVLDYADVDSNGVVDGTDFDENELFIYYINPLTLEVLILDAEVDAMTNQAEAPINRFGVYAIGCFINSNDDDDVIPFDPVNGELPASNKPVLWTIALLLGLSGWVYVRRISCRQSSLKQ